MKIEKRATLSASDLAQLTDLLVAVVDDGASVGFLPPLAPAEARAYWSEVLGNDVLLWVAEQDGEIVGAVQLHLTAKANGRHRAEVCKLFVHPRARRLGIGRSLMQELEAEARVREVTLLVLDTREGDPSNILYQSLGFVEAGRIPQYARSASGELHTTVFYYRPLN